MIAMQRRSETPTTVRAQSSISRLFFMRRRHRREAGCLARERGGVRKHSFYVLGLITLVNATQCVYSTMRQEMVVTRYAMHRTTSYE